MQTGVEKHNYRNLWNSWINIWRSERNIQKSCIRLGIETAIPKQTLTQPS